MPDDDLCECGHVRSKHVHGEACIATNQWGDGVCSCLEFDPVPDDEQPRTPGCDRCDSDSCQHCPPPSDDHPALTARERQ